MMREIRDKLSKRYNEEPGRTSVSNPHGEKRACDGVRNSRKQIQYI